MTVVFLCCRLSKLISFNSGGACSSDDGGVGVGVGGGCGRVMAKHSGGGDGGESLCKVGSCNSCRSTMVKVWWWWW